MTIQGDRLGEEVIDRSRFAEAVTRLSAGPNRFAGLFPSLRASGGVELRAVAATPGGYTSVVTELPPGDLAYPSVSVGLPAASWYEREIHDRYGIQPGGHPRLDPLVLPLLPEDPHPALGDWHSQVTPDPRALDAHASGEGLFTIPYGPVRSGVFEAVEYLVETFGEDIPRLRSRIYHKHRGIDWRFEDLTPDDGVLLAERVEGTASVAHAIAYCRGLEQLTGTEVPYGAEVVRLVHAELERVANHLDSMIRHSDGSYQAVANARLAVHKERLLRLRATLCGSRFGRNVVVPGGVSGPMRRPPDEARSDLLRIASGVSGDARAMMSTPSFLDRLRGAGVLPAGLVAAHGAVGPVARGSGLGEDVRHARPYGAYPSSGFRPAAPHGQGDALARQQVRLEEMDESFRLAAEGLAVLAGCNESEWRRSPGAVADGTAISAVESPQGELLYVVETDGGRLARVKPRCAAFHNFALFPAAFRGDILTDFVFIEASFGLSIAGVAG